MDGYLRVYGSVRDPSDFMTRGPACVRTVLATVRARRVTQAPTCLHPLISRVTATRSAPAPTVVVRRLTGGEHELPPPATDPHPTQKKNTQGSGASASRKTKACPPSPYSRELNKR